MSFRIKPQWLVITNTNAYGQAFKIICPQASVSGGLEFPFPADVSTDVLINKFTFTANAAVTEDEYEQLAWFDPRRGSLGLAKFTTYALHFDIKNFTTFYNRRNYNAFECCIFLLNVLTKNIFKYLIYFIYFKRAKRRLRTQYL